METVEAFHNDNCKQCGRMAEGLRGEVRVQNSLLKSGGAGGRQGKHVCAEQNSMY